ncbi:glutamate-1-semialdehyde 2,1-aminomutase [Paenibacillus polymyxa]|nr:MULTISPECIES: glutamate-1-semialdehyde 2,1-aminomutase [Paenibacillus]MCP3781469.1 glutamate-1-semialdehyde 2,1-aminomutase [Paenibacillus sp. MZ03-122A]MDY7991010.1 glutamate-1-semialdehyde 2,1-aminomutase [Paenibacillus polymyxa]MDY8120111.1 glutamate-1-semialdehyde 2,1-aminomutase [Paenibacillus polymyxa]
MQGRNDQKSKQIYEEALIHIPGGVNSPVRAFSTVGLTPVVLEKGYGSRVMDLDGNEFIDYIGSWGPLILGHAHTSVLEAIHSTSLQGTSFGLTTEIEVKMAKIICENIPSIEMVRMVNSGTEATMSALRLAKGFTKRNLIVKFDGGYHGHADELLVNSGSGVLTLGIQDNSKITQNAESHTFSLSYNNLDEVFHIFEKHGDDIAAIIVEPVAGNMGVVPARPEFLKGLREVTHKFGSLLIFDEVMTGFRVGLQGAQGLYGIAPDITCLGKIIGGGLPVGAYGGRREIMEYVAPVGPVYQAGTLSGNPLAMAAGYTTLKLLTQPGVYEDLERKASMLGQGFLQNAEKTGIPLKVNRVGSMMCPYFSDCEVLDFETVNSSNIKLFKSYYAALLNHGILVAPSPYEALFISTAHSDIDIEYTINSHYKALKQIYEEI